MSEAVEVLLWGRRIGVASRVDGEPCASFAYDREFQDAGIEPSPHIRMNRRFVSPAAS